MNIGIKNRKKGFNVDKSFIDEFNKVNIKNTKGRTGGGGYCGGL